MNNFEIGGLSEQDTIATKQLDSMSGFGLAPWVADTGPEENPFAWGLFADDRLLTRHAELTA